jgi:arsenate reductase
MTATKSRQAGIKMSRDGAVQRVESIAKALSDQLRIRILSSVRSAPLNLQQLTQMFGLAPSTISKHLHLLESAGLIVSQRVGKWRYFHVPDAAADMVVSGALQWLNSSICGDPLLETDEARRAVALTLRPAPAPKGDREKVLFLCAANACRSQMAEGILRRYGGHRFEVFSAGVAPRPIPPLTVEVMREIGVDISRQRPKSVMPLIGRMHFDYLITVCPLAESQTPVFPGVARRIHWPLDDPLEAKGGKAARLAVFRRVRDELVANILNWIGASPAATSPDSRRKAGKRRAGLPAAAPAPCSKKTRIG